MKTETITWLLACIVTGIVAFGVGWVRADRAESRARELAIENEVLRAKLGALETPERFDIESNEHATIAALRSILTAAEVYLTELERGYPISLQALGPSGTHVLDGGLAAGRRWGYVFTYTPVMTGNMCLAFRVVARPQAFDQTGRRSFFMDDSGVVRFTLEDREATASDRPL